MKKILIANRGEIAVRIIRTAREMGIRTVAVHSQVDAASMHVKLADESVCIGADQAKHSYLNMVSLLSACELVGADAVHPGYGFLSERAEFNEIVTKCGIKLIGPSVESMRLMGSKVGARAAMAKAGVPMLPGTGVLPDAAAARKAAKEIGYPVLLKASNGGGGRGMRIIRAEHELEQTFHSARSESQTAFGSPDVFLEKYVAKPRHIEIQVLADAHGNVIHLGERECSLQRRYQKIVEEALSPVMTPEKRAQMGKAACDAARAANYEGLGTVEFLVDEDLNFYFMEMNTRVQVEHPVTEEVTGLDLIREQIKVARGEKLPFKQSDIKFQGHSIECRINAEDPQTFVPCPGLITGYFPPGGRRVRVDSFVYSGYKVPPFYDSMIGKLITWGDTREEARITMLRALREFDIQGIKTNIPLHLRMLESEDFKTANFYTKWIEEVLLAKKPA
ncbi:MAG: acetyl-CoA carboxylase biotin carboxylase subunit [Bdellovibrionales bacterium]|nr:acetyl-CoA carboxylase biotin carboxylase subunit [Bdellovibrionales bacterium]